MATTIKPEVRDKWAAALESGEFQQTKGALRKDDSYCCLGVLCELYRRETGDGEWDDAPRSSGEVYFVGVNMRGTTSLPVPVREWAGLQDSSPIIQADGSGIGFAAYLNDHVLDFRGIARLIRQLPSADAANAATPSST